MKLNDRPQEQTAKTLQKGSERLVKRTAQRLPTSRNVSDDLLNIIELIAVTMDGMKGDVADDE